MKTYITPNTEYTVFINGGILCHSQDGKQLIGGSKPSDDKTPGTGNAAPKRVFW
jgi:hypothetical protein